MGKLLFYSLLVRLFLRYYINIPPLSFAAMMVQHKDACFGCIAFALSTRPCMVTAVFGSNLKQISSWWHLIQSLVQTVWKSQCQN